MFALCSALNVVLPLCAVAIASGEAQSQALVEQLVEQLRSEVDGLAEKAAAPSAGADVVEMISRLNAMEEQSFEDMGAVRRPTAVVGVVQRHLVKPLKFYSCRLTKHREHFYCLPTGGGSAHCAREGRRRRRRRWYSPREAELTKRSHLMLCGHLRVSQAGETKGTRMWWRDAR